MLNWAGMAALGLACENVAMIIGEPFTAMWLIFWVISNVSTSGLSFSQYILTAINIILVGFYSIDLAPGFFKWGYSWPLYNIVSASRTIIFDTYSHIGTNFGVLFGWIGVNLLLFPLCCLFMRMMKQKKEKEAKEE